MAAQVLEPNQTVTQFLAERERALGVVFTTTTPSGQTIDWVTPESLAGATPLATPPPTHGMPAAGNNPQRPVYPVAFELDAAGVARGPSGTVPVARPDLSTLPGDLSLGEYLAKRGGLLVNPHRPGVEGVALQEPQAGAPASVDPAGDDPDAGPAAADPSTAGGYFHAISSEELKAYGCDGFLSVWQPSINTPPSTSGDDHSIVQVWMQNYDKPQLQSLEAGWSVDQGLNGDGSPHLFTYYTTNGYTADGNNVGGYNRLYAGWVQVSTTIFPGIRVVTPSVQGGKQYELSFKLRLYQGNWWIAVRDEWIGYYPASLYAGGLGSEVEWIGFGGEVYSGLASPALTRDGMGSGRHPNDGWTHAAFLRNLRVQTDTAGTMVASSGANQLDGAGKPNPYGLQAHMSSGPPWDSYVYLGGPSA